MSRFHGGHDGDEAVFAEINITPFTDVVLVLLIIFMVTAPLLMESRIPVKLPVTRQAAMPPEDHPTVVLTSEGLIYLNNQRVESPAALTGALRGAILKAGDHTVVLRADAGARHGRVMECLDAAKAAGADRLAIATRQPTSGQKP